MSLENIPGYREAQNEEMLLRHAAFLPITENIGGFSVVQMTLRHYLILRTIRSPLLHNDTPSPHDIVRFLWILSPKFTPDTTRPKRWMLKQCRDFQPPKMPFWKSKKRAERWMTGYQSSIERASKILDGCRKYVSDTFMDRPVGVEIQGEDKVYFADACRICALFGREYGWTENDTLSMPLKRVFQYLNEIKQTKLGDKAKLWNPSDRVLGQHLDKLNSRN